ncbi:hypothetical protein [Psychroflexus sp. MES1-P1E]|uniref:hypothetical protein n=1 Tax=Psychroflexus sp. MES1-P1E TaxID=2058320 RepID=UPI000C799956|nr:hypothetical protein [Psychroflexus sp. MES1-P1E]PKG42811.1 hypothetical protein CXF67_08315 [Psychroflexus sp. MES1-P1E]
MQKTENKMILALILIISLFQLTFYFLTYRYKIRIPNFVILILVLIGYYFILPQFFYPKPRTDGINCGMPILGINLGFWIFGTIGALSSHIIWMFIKKKKNALEKM